MASTDPRPSPSLSQSVLANLPPGARALWDAHIANFSTTHPTHYPQKLDLNDRKGFEELDCEELRLDPNSETFKKWDNSEMFNRKAFCQDPEDLYRLKYTIEKIFPTHVDWSDHAYPLYIALHGGGDSKWIPHIDDAWQCMTRNYKSRIEDGIWVAIRGIGNTPDMHFTASGYVLVERLIEYMILFHHVDPNRVYLIGFSSGGDGAFRLGKRLAQRFAACEIGEGDPGDVQPDNFLNLPVCLQYGEKYEHQERGGNKFGRSRRVVEFGTKLDTLANVHLGYYKHNLYIHPALGYNRKPYWWDLRERRISEDPNHAPGMPRVVVQNYIVWLEGYETNRDNVMKIWDRVGITHAVVDTTNPIDWLKSMGSRNPTPTKVMWDLGVGNFSPRTIYKNSNDRDSNDNFIYVGASDLHGLTQNYWLALVPLPSIGELPVQRPGTSILGKLDKANNTVILEVTGETAADLIFGIRILLRPGMLRDLTQNICVHVTTIVDYPRKSGRKYTFTVRRDVGPRSTVSERVIKDTLVRNDPNLVFTSDIILFKDNAPGSLLKWSAMPYIP
ncbi:hypothetical protein V8F20_009480 [Naviculisporaceae sp. PSN 640]